MTVTSPDPLVCQHCALRRHADCLEPRCECACRVPVNVWPGARRFGLLRMLRRTGGGS